MLKGVWNGIATDYKVGMILDSITLSRNLPTMDNTCLSGAGMYHSVIDYKDLKDIKDIKDF